MKIAVTGATGMIGDALSTYLVAHGHHVIAISRQAHPKLTTAVWVPAHGQLDTTHLDACDAVIHLAGENIARRWSPDVRRSILTSRTQGTRLLAQRLAGLPHPPRLFISASAIGYYGPRPSPPVDEHSPAGDGLLAEVCQTWEEATSPAIQAGIPVIHLRLGLVLSPHGGALAKMLPLFRAGLGGPVGNGKQYLSWISITDLVRLIHMLIPPPNSQPFLTGPLNAVSPQPVTNATFARTLASVLHRPCNIPTPAFSLRLLFGQMADETLLADQQVISRKLQSVPFHFQHPDLHTALSSILRDQTHDH